MKRRWLSAVVLIAAGAIVFWLLPWLILKWSGYLLVVFPNGGDRTQTEVIDVSFRPSPGPLAAAPTGLTPRNVVFLLADGAGSSQLYAARLAERGAHGRLTLERFPVVGWQTSPSLDDAYTDSAASASSLYSGHKVEKMALSVDENGRALPTITEMLRDRGYAVGLVTDSYLWDASLTAHAVHTSYRYDVLEVAKQLAESEFDLLVGGIPLEDDVRTDLPDGVESLIDPLAEAGYEVLTSPEELPDLDGKTALLYQKGEVAAGDPTLAEIAEWALAQLSADGRPLFLFVETEEPDNGGHNRDFKSIVNGILSLDRVADVALEFGQRLPMDQQDTLVLATGDHETGGFAILSGSADRPLAIRWATTRHTSAPVPVLAWGAGSEHFSGVMDNTEVALRLRSLLISSDNSVAQGDSQTPPAQLSEQ